VTFPRSRRGSPADRGKIISFPANNPSVKERGVAPLLRRLAPGFLTGVANVDPSLVVTATVAGAAFRFSLLWVVLLSVPFLEAIFSASARLGYQTRKGLVDLLRENYGRRLALLCAALVIMINMAMIVADLMAVSDAMSIILGQRRVFFVAAVAFSVWYILIFRDYQKITHTLLWLSLPLMVYVVAAGMAGPDPGELVKATLIPRVRPTADYATAIVGLFGSLLTPYVLVWQTSSRGQEAERGGGRPHTFESHAGTFMTTVLSYSVIVAAASVLRLAQPMEMTTRQAAEALRPAVGDLGPILFSVGIIGAGMVALPILVASMCFSVSEAMGWKAGLSRNPWEAAPFYSLISLSTFLAMVANFFKINPVKALYFSQVLAGVLTVPIIAFILLLSNDRRIMQTTNSRWQNFWMGAAAGALLAAELLWAWWKIRG
jgi:Mn2+/Fe2+ NRAMP family transporter